MIVIVGLLYWVFAMRDGSPIAPQSDTSPQEEGTTRRDPSRATFIIDDEPVTLSNGHSEEPVAPNSSLVEETSLLDEMAYGDVNGDGREDTVVFLVRSGGGSGTFIYVAALVSGPITYKGSNAIFIGDRVSPQSIAVSRGVITVKYLDREADEPLAAEPSVERTVEFVYSDGELVDR